MKRELINQKKGAELLRLKTKSLEPKFLRAFLFVKSYNRGKKSCEVFPMFHKEKPDYNRKQYGFYTIDELVPKDHFLRQVDSKVDFDFIYDLVEDTYSPDNGRPSLDPVMLVKIPLIKCFYGIRSMRQTMKDIEVNVAYRWFLGLTLDDKVPHFTTYGKNYSRRFQDKELISEIFSQVLSQALYAGLMDPSEIFVDGTHIKAAANSHKYRKEMVDQ